MILSKYVSNPESSNPEVHLPNPISQNLLQKAGVGKCTHQTSPNSWEISQCHAPRLSGTRHPSAPREMKEWNGMLVLIDINGIFYNSEWLSLDLNGYSLFLVVINNG